MAVYLAVTHLCMNREIARLIRPVCCWQISCQVPCSSWFWSGFESIIGMTSSEYSHPIVQFLEWPFVVVGLGDRPEVSVSSGRHYRWDRGCGPRFPWLCLLWLGKHRLQSLVQSQKDAAERCRRPSESRFTCDPRGWTLWNQSTYKRFSFLFGF